MNYDEGSVDLQMWSEPGWAEIKAGSLRMSLRCEARADWSPVWRGISEGTSSGIAFWLVPAFWWEQTDPWRALSLTLAFLVAKATWRWVQARQASARRRGG